MALLETGEELKQAPADAQNPQEWPTQTMVEQYESDNSCVYEMFMGPLTLPSFGPEGGWKEAAILVSKLLPDYKVKKPLYNGALEAITNC